MPPTCSELVRSLDWAKTPLGPMETWPAALRSMVANMLHTRQPMLLFWGPELIQFYNDSFVPSFGQGKHPAAMGQHARECWADAWPVVGAQIEAVMSRGEPAWFEDAPVPIFRNGRMEEVFWTYSYSPAHDDRGEIYGTLVIVTEVTPRVLAARRIELLARLGVGLADATSHEDAFDTLVEVVAQNAADLPCMVLRNGTQPTRSLGIDDDGAARVLAAMDTSGLTRVPRELLVGEIHTAAWPEPITTAVGCSIASRSIAIAFGVSPRLPLDEPYRTFIAQVVGQLTSALRRIDNANASAAIEEQRDNLLMHAPIAAALLTGPDHVFQLANPMYRELAGRDVTGKSFREAFPELHDGETEQRLDRVYRTGESFSETEMRLTLARDGRPPGEQYVNYTIQPLRDEDNAVYGLMVVAADITTQVLARQALVEANRSKDEFLAMLGHELRNPLAPIVTALELMNQKQTTGAHERAVIERQVRHVVRLVDDLLDVSRITRGLITLDRRVVDLSDVVTTAVETCAPLIEQRKHRVTVEVPRGVYVSGDEARLLQIVTNLITNAARYTPVGGEVRVTLTSLGGEAVLRIADTGAGIAPELLPKVFEMFVQGERSADRADGGLGLGLAIVKNLVVLHGGSVVAESEGTGKGSVFTVRLALVEAPTVKPPKPLSRRVMKASETRRVLVVDDNEDAANLLAEIARSRGHDVVVSHDPQHALSLAAEYEPQVAVLDIGLPGMDGYELAQRLRATRPDCKLIALTGYGQANDKKRALDSGFSAHLVKPVRIDMLLELLTT